MHSKAPPTLVTLKAGFTTVRDVENEGSGYANVALRDAIKQGCLTQRVMCMFNRHVDEALPMPPQGAYDTDLIRRPKLAFSSPTEWRY